MSKSTLIVLSASPYSGSQAKEALDIVLAAATFEQDISFLLSGDACYLLLGEQEPSTIDQKNISQMIKALPIYGVDEILVDATDAQERNIALDDVAAKTTQLNKNEVARRIQASDNVLRF